MAAIQERLEQGEQSLILLNRRGFASAVSAGSAADARVPELQRVADGSLHGGEGRLGAPMSLLQLHEAGAEGVRAVRGAVMERVGFGTERVEADMRKRFRHARVARLDRDTVRRQGQPGRDAEQVAARDIDILIGTQMIAKGHDFPDVRWSA